MKQTNKIFNVKAYNCSFFCLGYRQANGTRVALTSGDWEVLGQQIWVNLEHGIVYFLGLREGPLEKHLYAVSLRNVGEIRLLTKPGHSYNVDFSEVITNFIHTVIY